MKTKDALAIGIKLGRLQRTLDAWEESKHPRANNGQFSHSAGGGAVGNILPGEKVLNRPYGDYHRLFGVASAVGQRRCRGLLQASPSRPPRQGKARSGRSDFCCFYTPNSFRSPPPAGVLSVGASWAWDSISSPGFPVSGRSAFPPRYLSAGKTGRDFRRCAHPRRRVQRLHVCTEWRHPAAAADMEFPAPGNKPSWVNTSATVGGRSPLSSASMLGRDPTQASSIFFRFWSERGSRVIWTL